MPLFPAKAGDPVAAHVSDYGMPPTRGMTTRSISLDSRFRGNERSPSAGFRQDNRIVRHHVVAAAALGRIETGIRRFHHFLRAIAAAWNQRRDAHADRDEAPGRLRVAEAQAFHRATQAVGDL